LCLRSWFQDHSSAEFATYLIPYLISKIGKTRSNLHWMVTVYHWRLWMQWECHRLMWRQQENVMRLLKEEKVCQANCAVKMYLWKPNKWAEIVLESKLKFELQCFNKCLHLKVLLCLWKWSVVCICCWLVIHNSRKCQQILCILKFLQLKHKNSDLFRHFVGNPQEVSIGTVGSRFMMGLRSRIFGCKSIRKTSTV